MAYSTSARPVDLQPTDNSHHSSVHDKAENIIRLSFESLKA